MAKNTAEYNSVLDSVETKAIEIAEFVKEHPDCQELMKLIVEYNGLSKEAADAIKDYSQSTGSRSFISEKKGVTGKVDLRREIDGDALIRDHGAELLKHNPRCLSVVKSEYNKFPLEGVDLDKYLEGPKFVATVTTTDKSVKTIIKCLEYLMECNQIESPEHADDIEEWHAQYDAFLRVLRN